MDISKTLKKNKDVAALFDEINNWKKIRFEKSSDNCWSSHIDENGYAVISYAPTKNKVTALAHELLHFKIQKDGYRRIKSVASSLRDKRLTQNLIDALDNELQHHRMYPLYIKMNLPKEKFYNDEDINTSNYLNQILDVNTNGIEDLILGYFTLVAPGGVLAKKEIDCFKKKFREKLPTPDPFDEVDRILASWVESDNLCAEDMIRDIFHILENPTETWVGYDDGSKFPHSGFFIDAAFTLEEFQSKYA